MARQMQENFRVKGKKLYFGFVDLEKAFDRVPREVISWAMRARSICRTRPIATTHAHPEYYKLLWTEKKQQMLNMGRRNITKTYAEILVDLVRLVT